jgi:hypothetical protein
MLLLSLEEHMDPNANLEEQQRLATRMLARIDADLEDMGEQLEDAGRLAELVLSLDEWLARGGFRPSTWKCECGR